MGFSNSFELVKESYRILKMDKEIMWFPIISGITTFLLFLSFVIPIAVFVEFDAGTPFYIYGIIFAYYVLSYFLVIFFNTGLISCAHIRLNGGDPTFKDGIRNARKNLGKIFAWAMISATVGIILKIISDRSNNIGMIVSAMIGIAWSLLTFFVIPVMIFENIGVFASIKRSGGLFRTTWGENAVGQFSMGLVFLLLGVAGLVPMVLAFFTGSIYIFIGTILLVILYWISLQIVASSLHGIFIAALYVYATTGKIPPAYNESVVRGAFAPKRGMFS